MKEKNIILKYFGLAVFIIGIGLNIKMYLNQEWPTYLFYIVCFIGILQITMSLILKKINVIWQVFWSLIPFILGFTYVKVFVH